MTTNRPPRSSGGKPVVRAGRRRPAGSGDSTSRQRAEAPERRRSQRGSSGSQLGSPQPTNSPRPTGSPRPSPLGGMGGLLGGLLGGGGGGGGGGTSGGAGRTGGCGPRLSLPLIILVAAVICAVVVLGQCGGGLGDLLGGVTDPGNGGSGLNPTTSAGIPQATAQPFVAPSGPISGETWLVMLYQDADDRILEEDIFLDVNEAERIGSTDNVHIVAQLDRYAGGFSGDGDWSGTRRYYITQDNDLNRIGSQLVEEIGEANMADPNTLVDFVTWAVETFPADRHALIMSDHGMGWPGGWSDPDPATATRNDTALSSALGNQMYLEEIGQALSAIRENTGLDRLELVGMDACLMGQLEVLAMLEPHARYAVVSEETEPALGWAYTGFLGALATNPGMDGAELGRQIVGSYITEDQRIVDDQARAALVRGGSPMSSLFGGSVPSSDQIARQMGRGVTLSAIDLAAVPALTNAVNELSLVLQDANQRAVAQARSHAQSFTSVFGQQVPPSYIDLGHFGQLLQQTGAGDAVDRAAANVLGAMGQAVIAETHGPDKPGATGVAIYYPNSQLYENPATGPQSYTAHANTFASTSLWDDFLAYHYTGRPFEADAFEAVVPGAGAAVNAPGQGVISMTPVQASDTAVSVGDTVLLSTDILAENLGHVLFFAGYYDSQADSLFIIDMDYMESVDTREVSGVYYPVWPDEEFVLEFEWEPIVFYLSDGVDAALATLRPEDYGATPEQATYTVDGTYTYTTGESRHARLYFANGVLQQVFGFNGDDATGSPWEIHPQEGDTFTVLEEWLDLDGRGRVVGRATQEGGTLTFRDAMFTWEIYDAAAGDYVLGFIARDLDGNEQQASTTITVR